MFCGISAMVFFSGMPSDAAGPVAETVTPTLTSANTFDAAPNAAQMATALATRVFLKVMKVSDGAGLKSREKEKWRQARRLVGNEAGMAATAAALRAFFTGAAVVDRSLDGSGS